ncbi:MAG: Mur ligase domain-containing protein [bacterium]|nr:Mur ligase domain-containing protein [bacterium]
MSRRRIFFIGIGGSGMEPLAKFALQAGDAVAGSDSGIDDARYAKLSDSGARIFREHSGANLDVLFAEDTKSDGGAISAGTRAGAGSASDSLPIVVYSSAIPPEHIERARAQEYAERGTVRLMHRMDFLNDCFRERPEALCVAGTHGKTSSSSMAGWALLESRLDPHIIVGGKPLYLADGVRFGAGRTGACETDESDGSFLKAAPALRLVLNVDRDHLEHYGDFANLCAAFARFIAAGRLCVLNAADPQLREIGAIFVPPVVGASRESSETSGAGGSSPQIFYYHAAGNPTIDESLQTPPERTYVGRFDVHSDAMQVFVPGESNAVGALQLKMPGRHFAGNALGVFALIDASVRQGLLEFTDYDPRRLLAALCEFPGVERRMEYLGRRGGANVFDDYGHHPTEIEAVLAACRLRLGAAGKQGRLLAVFQPHRYTRTAALYREFARALGSADRVYLLPLYSAGEAAQAGVDSRMIARELEREHSNKAGPAVTSFAETGQSRREVLEQAFAEIFTEVRPDDLLMCLGAGDISAGIRAYIAATRE